MSLDGMARIDWRTPSGTPFELGASQGSDMPTVA